MVTGLLCMKLWLYGYLEYVYVIGQFQAGHAQSC